MSLAAPAHPPGARIAQAWEVLAGVPDPEVPAVSVCDLGMVRDVLDLPDGLHVVVTPTYSGCPATEAIEQDILRALEQAGLGPARVSLRRSPAWTTDWISAQGRAKLLAYGIVPPGPADPETAVPVRFSQRRRESPALSCPRCGSAQTQQLAAFGSTACKSLYRCLSCREPFEHFKPL